MSELHTQALTLKEQATALVVNSPESYAQAGDFLKLTKEMEKQITAHYKPLKQAIDESKKKILSQEKADLEPVQLADGLVRKAVTEYLDREEAKRKAEEAAKIREAEEYAERERERLLKKAANTKDEVKQDALLEQAEMVYAMPVTVDHAVDKTVNGVTRKTETVVTVTDIRLFVAALVADKDALTMLDVKAAPLKRWVEAMGKTNYPGLVIEKKSTIAVRS